MLIKPEQITQGARFKSKTGITFIVDEVEECKGKKIIHSSLEHSKRKSYQDSPEEFLQFLNEEKCTKTN